MANFYSYKLKANTADSHQADPYWLALIVPFKIKNTFNNDFNDPGSIDEAKTNPVEEGDSILIDNDCIQWNVSSGKDSHLSSLSMIMLPTIVDYINDIATGDWVVFWAFNNFTDYSIIRQNLLMSSKPRCNEFARAPKFVGKLNSVMKNKAVDSSTGRIQITYNLNCIGFGELDAQQYYDPNVQAIRSDSLFYWADVAAWDGVAGIPSGIIETQKAIPDLLMTCVGVGPGQQAKTGNSPFSSNITMTPNEAYLVPQTIVDILIGKVDPAIKKVGYTYIDILKLFIGVHEYSQNDFLPKFSSPSINVYPSPDPLKDPHLLQPLYFNNETTWSILQSYLNEPINELFSCLRVDENDHVLPTLMCRQVPFSSPALAFGNTSVASTPLKNTQFLSLPRWEIDDSLIIQSQIGHSDALRFNYIHILPSRPGIDPRNIRAYLAPVVDIADIKRSSLKPKIKTLSSTFAGPTGGNAAENSNRYNKLMADYLFGSHLKSNGTVTLKGIQEPICQGDNCVVDKVIFHIESVRHAGSIDSFGRKDFITTLSLSNGVSIQSDAVQEFVFSTSSQTESLDSNAGLNFELDK